MIRSMADVAASQFYARISIFAILGGILLNFTG
jgi:hypothetical protein